MRNVQLPALNIRQVQLLFVIIPNWGKKSDSGFPISCRLIDFISLLFFRFL